STIAFNSQPYKIYSDLDPKFDKANMYKEVFGGYVLPASSTGSVSVTSGH
ncbi:phage tail protein, partial [Lacticaseibacillus casei]